MNNVIFDFDCTIVQLETLDELAKIVLADAPDAEERVAEIARITVLGMDGKIGFEESLARRLALVMPNKSHMEKVQHILHAALSPSFLEHQEQIRQHADNIWIISGGFAELIAPIADLFSISRDHILANDFIWGKDGQAVGYDKARLLAQNDGKVAAVRGLNLPPETTYMVGDGSTDYAVRVAGLAGAFVAYTETIDRPVVTKEADFVAHDFGEVAAILGWSDSALVPELGKSNSLNLSN